MKAPASKKPKPVYTTIARYEKVAKAQYDPEDIQYRIFEHARDFMYKSLQHYIPGNVRDPTDFHIWNLDREYLEDDGVTTVKFYRCPFQFQCNCSAGIKITEGPDRLTHRFSSRGDLEHKPSGPGGQPASYVSRWSARLVFGQLLVLVSVLIFGVHPTRCRPL
jgi:hypothetical protein